MGEHWSLDDKTLLAIGHQMRAEGVFHRVFYDGNVRTPEDFVSYMHRPSNLPIFFFRGTEPLGFAWLNGIRDGTALSHFCGFRAAVGMRKDIGRLALAYWFSTFDFLSVILGVIAANNPRAVQFVQSYGFTVLGEIPSFLYDAYEGQRVPGVLTYYAR